MAIEAALVGVAKAYGDVIANRSVSFRVRAGTIHALLGENGAGKSTAMKILYGLEQPSAGHIEIDGLRVNSWNPVEAVSRGVGMVHQHFMLADDETVLDNIVLGAERTRLGFRRRAQERERLAALMAESGLKVDLDVLVHKCSVGEQSRCEILKVLYRRAELLILDEPTAVLTPQEVQELWKVLRSLRSKGKSALIVTHKLSEILQIADEVTVLRQGETITTQPIAQASAAKLSEWMVGRRVQMPKVTARLDSIESALPVLGIAVGSTQLAPGKILGIAGIEGNGQNELVERVWNTCRKQKLRVECIPADRQQEGLALSLSLLENLRLSELKNKKALLKNLFSFLPKKSELQKELIKDFQISPARLSTRVQTLSGGNQQKLLMARALGFACQRSEKSVHQDLPPSLPEVLLAQHPTRGVDVGAIEFLHQRLIAACLQGVAVLLVSSELEELMALSHEILVLNRGKITKCIQGPPYSEIEIGAAMLA